MEEPGGCRIRKVKVGGGRGGRESSSRTGSAGGVIGHGGRI